MFKPKLKEGELLVLIDSHQDAHYGSEFVVQEYLKANRIERKFGLPVAIRRDEFRVLQALGKVAGVHEDMLQNLYEKASKAFKDDQMSRLCHYRVRPGKICMAKKLTGSGQTARCKEHKGLKNTKKVIL